MPELTRWQGDVRETWDDFGFAATAAICVLIVIPVLARGSWSERVLAGISAVLALVALLSVFVRHFLP